MSLCEREKNSPSTAKRKKIKFSRQHREEKGQSGRSNNDHGGQKHEIASRLSSTRLGDTLSMYTYPYTNERT